MRSGRSLFTWEQGATGLCLCFLLSCTSPEERIFKEGLEQSAKSQFTGAVQEFKKVVKRSSSSAWGVRAAKEAARISLYELKDYSLALEFLKSVVLYAKDPNERIQAETQIAAIYFDNMQNYPMAIREYTKLLQLANAATEIAKIRLVLARSYFYMSDFKQAEIEIQEILKLKIDPELLFSALSISGNVKVAQKDFLGAAETYRGLIARFPERSIQENIQLSLAVCYEENGDFVNALSLLNSLKGKYNPAEYLELRIKRVLERQKNMPGARGYRK